MGEVWLLRPVRHPRSGLQALVPGCPGAVTLRNLAAIGSKTAPTVACLLLTRFKRLAEHVCRPGFPAP